MNLKQGGYFMAEKLISKEQTWKGLRMELSSEELQSIFQQERTLLLESMGISNWQYSYSTLR